MIESMTGRSRPDFRAVALLRTAHRSFGRSAFILQRGQVKRGTSEPRKLHWRFMQANAPCESTATDNAGKRLSHFLPGRLLTLSSLKKLDRCTYCIPVLSSYDNELTAFAHFWN